MGETTGIQWAHATFNLWRGCAPVSPGCANCYASALSVRFGEGEYRQSMARIHCSENSLHLPRRWNRRPPKAWGLQPSERGRVFNSLNDWLDDRVPIEWLAELLIMIDGTPNLDHLLLTKRPQLFHSRLTQVVALRDGAGSDIADLWLTGHAPPNVWLGASVEDQARADERIPLLAAIPARIRFLSVEPLLSRIEFGLLLPPPPRPPLIHWAIIGGESDDNVTQKAPGKRRATFARLCEPKWILDVMAQMKSDGIRVFVKQLGSNLPIDFPPIRHPKGGDQSEWPAEFQVREFPAAGDPAAQRPAAVA